jgi:arginine utilization protein RocB
MTYAELRAAAEATVGEDGVAAALRDEWKLLPTSADKRLRCLALVQRLWSLSGRSGPAVIVYFSPPFYPHVKASPSPLHEAVAEVAAGHPEIPLVTCEYFPFLSDMSYLRLDSDIEASALTANMPLWHAPGDPDYPGGYSLPLEAIRQLDLPVVNLGPYGRGAHQRGERALMSYSFAVLPQLVYETIMKLATAPEASR